jgi:hypothetical protein
MGPESCSTGTACSCGVRPVRQFLPRPLDIDCLKGVFVTSIVVAMIVILVVAACTVGLVLLGMEGRGKQRAPRLADRAARAAEHLNGEGEPPARFIKLIESTRGR